MLGALFNLTIAAKRKEASHYTALETLKHLTILKKVMDLNRHVQVANVRHILLSPFSLEPKHLEITSTLSLNLL